MPPKVCTLSVLVDLLLVLYREEEHVEESKVMTSWLELILSYWEVMG